MDEYPLIECGLYEWIPRHIRPKWYHGFAYYDASRDERLYVLMPFNLVVRLVFWSYWKIR